ncbi:serine/threonine-protein kinase [Actinomadura sp. KC345]|uniref:protein kinase domain-containing protein n=1 Tax=Actinomadura sp. KC345 TaxID=2530371 RepID=UPI00104A4CEE|nr:protein kinase [Actinomadura sp. KC345]TDC44589.1 serine/threonine-protein kinase [Actinomadura sp. KC345]
MDGPRASSLGEPRPGDPTRIGRYRIEAKIGEGGMGAVYLGRDPEDRRVAVKVVRSALAGDRTFLARFHDEAANAQRVASFCTAQVLEHGDDLGLAYMVTEYIDGPSLLEHVTENGALSPGMLHGVAVGVAAALVAIHSAGLVHRDLKPSNVLLSISGPRVIDFGIARALDVASAHTRTGQVVGTPGWIAPEQITAQQVTPAVDVFAWGCLVAFAANGRNPFGQGTFQLLAARAVHAEPEIGELPPSLAGLVRSALRKEPGRRPSARDLLLALVGGAAEADVTTELGESWTSPPGDPTVTSRDATTPSPAPPVLPPAPGRADGPDRRDGPSRRTTLIAAGVAGVLAAAAVAGGLYYFRGSSGEAEKPPGPAAFPSEPMLVRVDTRPGWPESCHADIARFTPGEASATTLAGGDRCEILPEPSPDGRRIAFTRTGGGSREAWVMNADGSGARKVTDIAGGRVTWSPDGTRLAYMGEEGGTRQIFTITLQGREVTRLTRDGSAKDDPMWSSTRKLVFWSDRDGEEEIYTLDPNAPGSPWTKLTRDGVRSVDPEWSPDGSRIAFTRGESDGSSIWVMNADGSGARAVTTGTRDDMDPAWSPDGNWIVYARGAVSAPVLRAVRLDGTGDRVVTPRGHVFGHPNWS